MCEKRYTCSANQKVVMQMARFRRYIDSEQEMAWGRRLQDGIVTQKWIRMWGTQDAAPNGPYSSNLHRNEQRFEDLQYVNKFLCESVI